MLDLEPTERAVEVEQLLGRRGALGPFGEEELFGIPLGGGSGAGAVDQNPAHAGGGEAEEVDAIAPFDSILPSEPQKRLVDEAGHLESLVSSLVAHLRPGDSLEFDVDLIEESRTRLFVSLLPGAEQHGQIACPRLRSALAIL